MIAGEKRTVDLGVIEFHSERVNPGLIARFYHVVNDLRESGSIVDVWLMDISTVLSEFGYETTITTTRPKPTPVYETVRDVTGADTFSDTRPDGTGIDDGPPNSIIRHRSGGTPKKDQA